MRFREVLGERRNIRYVRSCGTFALSRQSVGLENHRGGDMGLGLWFCAV